MSRFLPIFVGILLSIHHIAVGAEKSGFTGSWSAQESPDFSFSLILTQVGDKITGYHIAIAHHGNRIDAVLPKEGDPSIIGTISKGIAHVRFKSGYSDATGEAQIVFKKDLLEWSIIQKSPGDCYIPQTSTLYRENKIQTEQGAAANP